MTFSVPAVSCAHCKMAIENAVGTIPGVVRVIVDVDAQRATVEFDRPADVRKIERVLTETGYPPARA